ncbi:MAG: VCBS repeat-containing protein, partial [Magnetococcales bacterium]|nr:VCBS repeat-containing protein [Magnetococcales bacterium]
DFNSDGRQDIAALSYDGQVTILLGDGKGVFTVGEVYYPGGSPSYISAVDLDNNKLPDIIISDNTGFIKVLLNQTYLLDLAALDDTGSSDSDNITNKTSLTLTGGGNSGDKMVLFDGSSNKGTATVTAGTWSLKLSGLSQGSHSFTTKQLTGGTLGAASAALVVSIDTTAPAATTNLDLAAADDTGTSNSDNITSKTSGLTISGSGGEVGAKLVLFDDKDNDGVIDSGEALVTSTITTAAWSADIALAVGTHGIKAVQTDVAGNGSAVSKALEISVNTPSLSDGLIAYYPFEDYNDISGNNHTGTPNGSLSFVSGVAGQGLSFDGGYVDLGDWFTYPTFSVSLWVKPSADQQFYGNHIVIDNNHSGGDPGHNWAFQEEPDRGYLLVTYGSGSDGYPNPGEYRTANTPLDSTWHFIIFTHEQTTGTTSLYVDGKLFDSYTMTSDLRYADQYLRFGEWPGMDRRWYGVMDEVRMYDRVLSDGEIQSLYTNTSAYTDIDLSPADDTGLSDSDNITNKTSFTLTGSGSNGAKMVLFDGSSNKGTATVTSAGTWSLKLSGLSQGSHSFTTKQLTGGTLGTASAALVVSIDTTAPAAVTALDLADESDNGVSPNDNITSITEGLIVNGQGEAGALVSLYAGKSKVAEAIVVGEDGSWSGAIGALSNGNTAITAVQSDVAGNVSKASAALNLVVDTVAPAAPTKLDLAASDDSGGSRSDNITAVANNLTVSGSGEKGARLYLFDGDASDINSALATATVGSSGQWTADIPELAIGDHAILAVQVDAAGNQSPPSAALSLSIIEAALPDPPTALTLLAADDTGSVGDGVTYKTGINIIGSGSIGAKVVLSDNGSSKGTTNVTAAGNWNIKLIGLSQGSHSFAAQQIIDGVSSGSSNALEVSIDTAAPVAPTGFDLADESDGGWSPSDNITSVTENLTFSGRGEAGNTVILLVDKNKNGKLDSGELRAAGPIVIAEDGNWSGVFETLAAGSHTITAVQTDLAGNSSKAATLLVTIDTIPPAAPTKLDLASADDSGSNRSDNITTFTSNLTFGGSGEKGLRVYLFEGNAGDVNNALATTTVSSSGQWSVDVAELAVGTHAIVAVQMDLAGNSSPASKALDLNIIESVPPLPPTVTLLASDDTGVSSSDGITNKNKGLTLTGVAEIGAKITLFEEGLTKAIGTTNASLSGNWKFKVASLTAGTHTFTAQQTTDNGSSGDSLPLTIVVDSSLPTTPSGLQLNGSFDSLNTVTNGAGLAITGNGDEGAMLTLFDDSNKDGKLNSGELLTTTSVEGGVWATSINLFGGSHSIRAIQSNVAGSVSKVSAALAVVVQTPGGFDLATEDDTGLSKADNITSKSSGLTLSGTALGASQVTLFIDGAEYASAAVTKGLWKLDLTLSSSIYGITATQTDATGNVSEPSIPFILVVDSEAPSPPTDLAVADAEPADHYITNKTAGLALSGRGEPEASITLFEGKANLGTTNVDDEGRWRLTLAKISNGNHTFTAQQTDIAGNSGPVSELPLLVSVDSVAPAAPSNLKFSNNIISGKGESGAVLTLFEDVDNNNSFDEASDGLLGNSLVEASGSWSINVDLAVGKHTGIRAIQADLAGNISKISSALNVTIAASSLTRPFTLQDYSGLVAS